jgi:hypothetical protein
MSLSVLSFKFTDEEIRLLDALVHLHAAKSRSHMVHIALKRVACNDSQGIEEIYHAARVSRAGCRRRTSPNRKHQVAPFEGIAYPESLPPIEPRTRKVTRRRRAE